MAWKCVSAGFEISSTLHWMNILLWKVPFGISPFEHYTALRNHAHLLNQDSFFDILIKHWPKNVWVMMIIPDFLQVINIQLWQFPSDEHSTLAIANVRIEFSWKIASRIYATGDTKSDSEKLENLTFLSCRKGISIKLNNFKLPT